MVSYSLVSHSFTWKASSYLDIFNESCILVLAYAMFGYTDLVLDGKTKYKLGWWAIAIFAINFICNILFIFYTVLRLIFKKLQKKCKCLRRKRVLKKVKIEN